MKILLLGGTGFLSSRVLHHAIRRGHEVLYITRGIRPTRRLKRAIHINADRDRENLCHLLRGKRWDAVIDAICRTPKHARQAVALSKDCRRLIMVSTDYVYDPRQRRLPQNEKDAVYTKGISYGAKKRKAELEILDVSKRGIIDATILRPPHIYGPGSYPGTIPNHGRDLRLLSYIKRGRILRLIQAGHGLIQPIHVDDIARIILEIIPKKKSYGEIYNCPGPELMTHRDYYMQIGKCIGKKVHIIPYYPPRRKINPFPSGHRYYDNSKLLQLLPNFRFTPFEKGVRAWVKYLQRGRK